MPIEMLLPENLSILQDSKQIRSDANILRELLKFVLYDSLLNIRRSAYEPFQTSSVRIDGFALNNTIDTALSNNYYYDSILKSYKPLIDINGIEDMLIITNKFAPPENANRLILICLIKEISGILPNQNFNVGIIRNDEIEFTPATLYISENFANNMTLLLANVPMSTHIGSEIRIRFESTHGAELEMLGYTQFCY